MENNMGKFVLANWTPNWYNNAKPEAQQEFKSFLREHLSTGQMQINFTKADGTQRVMNCTLDADLLPALEETKETTRKENINVLCVWDLDKQAWRSFKLETIQEFKHA